MTDLNKPATRNGPYWAALDVPLRWYLWEGGFLVFGRAGGEVPTHSHHAIQVFIAFEGKVGIRTAGQDWSEARGIVVRADVEHAFDARGATGAMLFVDPESAEGTWLQSALTQDITHVPDARLQPSIDALRTFWERPLEAMPIGELIRHCVRALCPGGVPTRKLDRRIANVLKAIRESEELKLSLEEAAELAHLSPGRFAHLFKEELGLPFRRYLLWRKLARAMVSIGKERTLADAAQKGDFADAAHLTRTFQQMFGISPSVLMRGEFFEIEPPFTQAE